MKIEFNDYDLKIALEIYLRSRLKPGAGSPNIVYVVIDGQNQIVTVALDDEL